MSRQNHSAHASAPNLAAPASGLCGYAGAPPAPAHTITPTRTAKTDEPSQQDDTYALMRLLLLFL